MAVVALSILVDFALPGNLYNNEVINVQKKRQQYYNAARNFHYSYKVITNSHQFSITEEFAQLELITKKIEYAVSPIFKEVNWYKLSASQNTYYYSLRIFTGLVLPLLTVISLYIAFKKKKEIGLFLLILQIVLIADFIFLLQ